MPLAGARRDFADAEADVVTEVRAVRVVDEIVRVDNLEVMAVGVEGAGMEVVKVAEDVPVVGGELQAVRAFPIRTTARGRPPKAALFYFPGCGCGLNSSHLRMSRYLENIQTPLTAVTVGWDEEFFFTQPMVDGRIMRRMRLWATASTRTRVSSRSLGPGARPWSTSFSPRRPGSPR